jgi:hypothetical protein
MTIEKEKTFDTKASIEHANLLLSSFRRTLGRELLPSIHNNEYLCLYHAPFCVLSHSTEADPIFNYGNKTAQVLFEMDWNELIRLPSRLSAEVITQEEREALLTRVKEHGFIDNYQGVRVSATGKRFFIEDAIVWNVLDEDNNYHGQAAALYKWTKVKGLA